jgi:hypothetical protein
MILSWLKEHSTHGIMFYIVLNLTESELHYENMIWTQKQPEVQLNLQWLGVSEYG